MQRDRFIFTVSNTCVEMKMYRLLPVLVWLVVLACPVCARVDSYPSAFRIEDIKTKSAVIHVRVGGKPITWTALICELQRDCNRTQTVPGFSEVLFAVEGH